MQIIGKTQQAMNNRNTFDSWIKKIWMIPAECVLTYLRRQLSKRMNMEFTVTGYEYWHFHLLSMWPWKDDLNSIRHTFLNFILAIVIPAGIGWLKWNHMCQSSSKSVRWHSNAVLLLFPCKCFIPFFQTLPLF